MTMFNAQVNAIGVDVQKPEEENHLIVSIDLGMMLPLSAPGSEQPMVFPAGKLNFPITKDAAQSLSKRLGELAEELSAVSNIAVASNLSEVEKAAQEIERFRKGA